jgi:SAM-dependent methyltransferase
MLMNPHTSDEQQIDDAVVQRYFDGAWGKEAATVSMMAHEHNLPGNAARYRISQEIRTIDGWLDSVSDSGRVLDVGCGAGAWVEIFAKRYGEVVGVERSPLMVKAAREKVAHLPNADILEGDGRKDLPAGPFEMIFLGGLCMYLKDAEVVELLDDLKHRLSQGGLIILRESTVRQGISFARGDYQAVYRSVETYRQLFEVAGLLNVGIQRNYGYNSMVTAEELVDLRRKVLPFLPKDSPTLGSLTWGALRGTSPISFWALPRLLSLLNIAWPKLQNHFFSLRPEK